MGLAVLSLLLEVTTEQPLICVIDDEQWLDRASAQALGFVARRWRPTRSGWYSRPASRDRSWRGCRSWKLTDCGTMTGRVPARVRRPDPGNGERMTEPSPPIDVANLPAPAEGIVVTMFITVRSVARSRDFYSRVLGGTVVLEENPCIVKLSNSWILMNPGGPPTPDKPGISVVNYEPGDTTSIFLNLRVADIQACYEEWKSKGAEFVTPPIDREAEIRCYMRDPDGYMIEVGQATGALHGHLAKKRPEDLPG